MKIAIIDTGNEESLSAGAREFLPKLLQGLVANGNEVHLFTKDAPAGDAFEKIAAQSNSLFHRRLWQTNGALAAGVHDSARQINEFETNVYVIWNGDAAAWAVLPLINPATATVGVGHADSELFYAPARHYRSFLTRVVGATPETSVGFVINCVIEKERVEWIAYDEAEDPAKIIETYETCFEKAIADAIAAPREISEGFPPLSAPRSEAPSWFDKLKAKIMN